MTFKVGDRVKIASDSVYYGGMYNINPRCGGTITLINSKRVDGYNIEVSWDNRYINQYRFYDLVRE